MGAIIDGTRSLLRLHNIKTLLRQAQMLGLPLLQKIHDGFRYVVLNLDDGGVEKMRITAPMGAAVVIGLPDGIHLFIADHYCTAIEYVGKVHLGTYPFQVGRHFYTPARQYETSNFLPAIADTPSPALIPHPGEAFWLGRQVWIPVEGNPAKTDCEIGLNIYPDRGRAGKRTAIAAQNNVGLNTPPQVQSFITPKDTVIRAVAVSQNGYGSEDGMRVLGAYMMTNVAGDSGILNESMYALIWFYGIPPAIRDAIAYAATPQPYPVWSYAWENPGEQATVMHACSANDYIKSLNENPPVNDKWRLFFSFYTIGAGTVTTFSANNFLSVLHNLKPSYGIINGGNVDWGKAYAMLQQLIGFPVHQNNVLPDTMTFAHGGDVYTWTRPYGSVKFSRTTGLTTTSLAVPSVVANTAGARPTLTYLGDGVYFCAADKPCKQTATSGTEDKIGVLGIYKGSPFAGWTELAMPESPWKLVQVRPVRVEAGGGILCLGVVHREEAEPPVPESWNFAMLAGGAWKIMGTLNITIADPLQAAFDTCVFGDDPLVVDQMRTVPQPSPKHYITNKPYDVFVSLAP